MALIKIREVIATSSKSFEDALQEALKHAAVSKKNVTGMKILNQSVEVKDDKIVEYKVNIKVAYRWEE